MEAYASIPSVQHHADEGPRAWIIKHHPSGVDVAKVIARKKTDARRCLFVRVIIFLRKDDVPLTKRYPWTRLLVDTLFSKRGELSVFVPE